MKHPSTALKYTRSSSQIKGILEMAVLHSQDKANFIYLFILAIPHGLRDLQLPDQGIEPGPPQWEHGVLNFGLPGNSSKANFK